MNWQNRYKNPMPGDKIEIVEPRLTAGQYKKGDILTIKEGHTPANNFWFVEENMMVIDRNEFRLK